MFAARAGLCVLASLLPQLAHAQPARYTLTDLGPGAALGVGNDGVVVGTSNGQAVMWFGRNMIPLWGSPGENNAARSVNDHRQVVGVMMERNRCKETPCFPELAIWDDGVLVDVEARFGTPPPITFAADINNAGQIATDGFLFDLEANSFRQYVNAPDLGFIGNAINADGVVAGRWFGFSFEIQLAATWTSAKGGTISIIEYPDARTSDAAGISDAGQVVGFAFDTDSLAHPFTWRDGVITDLQARCIDNFADPRAVNAGGTIVGNACGQALVWHGSRVFALDRLVAGGSHLLLLAANDVSNTGLVVGSAVTQDGDPRAFLLTPIECLADWDGSTTLNSADFFDFLDGFFDGNADFDFSGETNSVDFFAYLTAFFAGC